MYRYIKAMSDNKSEIHYSLGKDSEKITEHIIKLLLFPGSRDYDHWKQEIYSFRHLIATFKHNKKLPSKKFIYDGLTIYSEGRFFAKWKREILKEYSELTATNTSIDAISYAVEMYYNFLSGQLSSYGEVDRVSVYAELDKIVERYSGI